MPETPGSLGRSPSLCVLSWCKRLTVDDSKFCAEHAVTWGLPVLSAPASTSGSDD